MTDRIQLPDTRNKTYSTLLTTQVLLSYYCGTGSLTTKFPCGWDDIQTGAASVYFCFIASVCQVLSLVSVPYTTREVSCYSNTIVTV